MLRPLFFLFSLIAILLFGYHCKKHTRIAPPGDLEALLMAADTFRKHKNNDSALIVLTQSLPLLKKNGDLNRWLISQRRISYIVGTIQQRRVEALDIIRGVRDTIAIWKTPETFEENHNLALLYTLEAGINLEIGDHLQMQESLERTEIIFKRFLFGKDHDVAWYFFSEMANVYTRLGEFENAEQLFQESLAYEKKFNDKDIASHNDYGSAHLSQGNYQTAVSIFEQGLKAPFVDTFTNTLLLLNLSEGLSGVNSRCAFMRVRWRCGRISLTNSIST